MKHIKNFKDFLKEAIDNNNVYYHGSQYYFDDFCNDKKDISIKTGGNEYSYGTYLTHDKNIAVHYAKNTHYLYTVKLKHKLNFLSDVKKVSKNNLEKIRNVFINNDFEDNKGNKMSNEHKLFIINNIIKDSKNGLDLYNKILRIFTITDKELSEMLDDNGINGLIGNEQKEIIIYNPLNIEIISIEKLS